MQKFLKLLLLVMIGSVFLIACTRKTPQPAPTLPTPTTQVIAEETAPVYGFDDPIWWEHAVFYEIFVRSFSDSNGDGIGDFNGIIEKLDYLNDGDPAIKTDLGINAIWLMPIFPSPSYHGYDVTDYLSVNPQYGTMEDFKRLLSEAHKRGIHVIIDFVINHTSIEHPWFVDAQNPGSKYHDWYIWSEADPGYLGPWGQKVWHQAANGLYYYGIFWEGMPDLNFANPAVTSQIESAADYWVNTVGVDGFRIDGAKHLIEEGTIQQNSKSTITWFTKFMALYKSWNPSVMSVGEVWDSSKIATSYLKSKSFDMVFDFDLASALISNVRNASPRSLSGSIATESSFYNGDGMGTFLANHDMDRVLSQFGDDVNKAKHAATIFLTIPGTPFVYYGEEIGMVGAKPDEQIRTPMQWSSENGAGFTTGTAWEAINSRYKAINVATETKDKRSLVSLYRNLIQTRVVHPALLDGEYIKVEPSNAALYGGLRVKGDDIVLTIVNLKDIVVEQPSFKFKSNLFPGTYLIKVLVGDWEVDAVVELVKNGDYIQIKFATPITSQQNLVIQIAPKK